MSQFVHVPQADSARHRLALPPCDTTSMRRRNRAARRGRRCTARQDRIVRVQNSVRQICDTRVPLSHSSGVRHGRTHTAGPGKLALAFPCAAALRYHFNATTSFSLPTPLPSSYSAPRLTLGIGQSLFGGLAIPFRRLDITLRNAKTRVVAIPKIVLRAGSPPGGGFADGHNRLRVAGFHFFQ